MSFRTWIYHETEEAKIINSNEREEYFSEGWADSPARFINLEDMGIDNDKIQDGDEHETAKAQQALQAVDGVVDYLNGELNLDELTEEQLEKYLLKHFGEEADKRSTAKTLRVKIRALIDDDS